MIATILFAVAATLPKVQTGAAPADYTPVPAPKIEMRVNEASATAVPWVDANGWRFIRGLDRVVYKDLPDGVAPLAAAEAYAYGVDAVLQPSAKDTPALDAMLKFLAAIPPRKLPPMANIGIVDDGSAQVGEVLNLLSRRNLLYRVEKQPDSQLDINIKVGSNDYPKSSIANPNDFAARVREKLGDEKRSLRIFGTYTVIGYLTGDGEHARLHLLNYAKRPAKDVRVRVLGVYPAVSMKDSTDATLTAQDMITDKTGTEFTVPSLATYTVVDLDRKH